ncbi:YoxC [Elusimicrobium posterum]|uniref:hypothetical protein n=1 Tax=Elusimicrobium posterum TaxID=3116653 RepID=UPI003C770430
MLVYQICAGIITVAFVVLVIYLIKFLMQARITAIAVEELVLNANEQVEKTSKTFELIEVISDSLNCTVAKLLGLGIAISKARRK